mmetsp:Transcript_49533/g.73806  ORF Transcript_49533/g.73806 Transcript_49533/m.73806 type:complete len:94 (-) Transcript_49533:513-794(-)
MFAVTLTTFILFHCRSLTHSLSLCLSVLLPLDNQAAKIDRLKAVIVGLKQDGKKALDEMMKSKNELKDQLNAKIEEMGDDCDKLANIFNQPGN